MRWIYKELHILLIQIKNVNFDNELVLSKINDKFLFNKVIYIDIFHKDVKKQINIEENTITKKIGQIPDCPIHTQKK